MADTISITIELPNGSEKVTRLLHALEEYFTIDDITLTPDITSILDKAGVGDDWTDERKSLISRFKK